MWGGDYYDRYERDRDDDYAFTVTCSRCGCEYLNNEGSGDCPSCGSGSGSYSGRDASRWNEHLRRTGR